VGVTTTTQPTETKRGDREGRRRDILRAAADLLHTKGYSELSMRDIAGSAGVSAGTPYSYFAGKEEIFATLLTQRFEELAAKLDRLGGTGDRLEDLFMAVAPEFDGLHDDFAQHITAWLKTSDDSSEITVRLGEACETAMAALEKAVRLTAGRAGRELAPGKLTATLLWSMLMGLANARVSGVHRLYGHEPGDLVELSVATLLSGLVVNDDGK